MHINSITQYTYYQSLISFNTSINGSRHQTISGRRSLDGLHNKQQGDKCYIASYIYIGIITCIVLIYVIISV